MKTTINPSPDQWLDEYGDALFRHSLFRVNDAEQAKDLVQDTLISALQSLDNFAGKSSVRTWLFSILKHKILDYYRKKDRSPQHVSLDDMESDIDSFSFDWLDHWNHAPAYRKSPSDQLEEKELRRAFEICFHKLPKPMGEALAFRLFDDIAVQEICKIMNISATNVSVILYRARLHLRECLNQNWFKER